MNLSLKYSVFGSPCRNATMKRSRRKRHHRPLADTKNPTFFIGSSNGTDAIVDSLVTDENSFNFSTSSSFVNVGCSVDVANSSVAPLPGSRRSLQVYVYTECVNRSDSRFGHKFLCKFSRPY